MLGSVGEVTDHSLPAPPSNVIKARGGARKTLKPHPNVHGYHESHKAGQKPGTISQILHLRSIVSNKDATLYTSLVMPI